VPWPPPLRRCPQAPLARPGLRAAIRVLPLGDPVHRSPAGQYPVPAGEDWSLDARSRVRGPLTGPLALHMLALPARPALTADSVLGPQRDGRAHCARRVGTPPAIRHSVPAWQCPAESGRGPPRPGDRRSSSEQAPCARLVGPSKCRPGDRPRPGNTSCPSDQAPCARLVATKDPVWRITASREKVKLPAIRHACPPGSDQQIRADGSPPAGERSSSRRSSTHARPRVTSRSAPADHRRPANDQAPGDQARLPARE
jgi:hypothetical protein